MGFEPALFSCRPCDLPAPRSERGSVDVVCPPVLRSVDDEEDRVRAVALDVHRDFCEVAIVAGGRVRSAGRVAARPDVLELFARSLDPRDWVALEVTGNAWAIAPTLEPHVARVIVVSPSDTGSRQARAKTDRHPVARARHSPQRAGSRRPTFKGVVDDATRAPPTAWRRSRPGMRDRSQPLAHVLHRPARQAARRAPHPALPGLWDARLRRHRSRALRPRNP
jgi:hypothetical protein